MMRLIALLSITLLTAAGLDPVHAGTIKGTVKARGVETDTPADSDGGYASRKFMFAEKVDYDEYTDFVVSIVGPINGAGLSTNRAEIITQKDATFNPRILPIAAGTTVEWPNRDDIFHNVFSFSETKSFDLGLYKEGDKTITFEHPGRVDVFCSIHKNMHCIILVLENPYFAQTDKKGRYSIPDVPAGTYQLKAWHERMPPQTLDVVVTEDGVTNVDFIMGITGLPKY